jgi:hypothetical protein
MENYFIDLNRCYFHKYAKALYDDVSDALDKNDKYILERTLNPIYLESFENDTIKKYFPKNTSDWEIVHGRIFWNGDIFAALDNHYAQITMMFKADGKDNYIIFERNLSENCQYLSWKIFIINYNYFL